MLHKELEERQRAEEAFKNLFFSPPIGIYVIQEGRFKLTDPGFEKITGFGESETQYQEKMVTLDAANEGKRTGQAFAFHAAGRESPLYVRK